MWNSAALRAETAKMDLSRWLEKDIYLKGVDTSISRSKQLESAVPPSKISALSSGDLFVW